MGEPIKSTQPREVTVFEDIIIRHDADMERIAEWERHEAVMAEIAAREAAALAEVNHA